MPRRSVWRTLQFDTLRLRLTKIAASVVELKTMIRIQWPTACPNLKILPVALDRIPRLITWAAAKAHHIKPLPFHP